ncbi:hypothetical protein FKR81_33400 [Lentzea tibetensis]|uniref:Uncharacterized protein n=1 Tax=Lentzea tibetensis TaxID=2591470 RepID=A0A563EJS3_9PSEU|nr:hypothetical protein [Lentzea tibetensis]TWP46955.1 hypothetical protein FKR81_33400 [Lentzea tibetensis]
MRAGRWLTAVAAVAVVISGSASQSSAESGPSPAWRLATLPDNKPTSNLWDVAAADATHAWAVGFDGYHPSDQYNTGVPMILRWNGAEWSRAEVPPVPWKGSWRHVAAGSATDVWVLGGPMSHGIDDSVTVVLHHDGNTWSEVPFPAGSTPSALSITDMSVVDGHVWLVGRRGSTPVTIEWTGAAWVEHQPPADCVRGSWPRFCTMAGIKAFAADDVWAVGNGFWTGFQGPLLYHWNGSAWRTVDIGLNGKMLTLQAIDGSSSKNVWAVGDTLNQGGGTLAVHGDGTTWQVVSGIPRKATPGVAVGAAGAPWVIGNNTTGRTTLITHTSGAWTETPAPTPAVPVGPAFNAITAVPGTDRFIAVGSADLPGTSPLRVQAVVIEYAPA